jgi:hypothetical protein
MPRAKKKPKKLSERPQGTGKRLTKPEKLLILSHKDTGRSKMAVAAEFGVSDTTVGTIWKSTKLSLMKKEVAVIKEAMADRLYLTADQAINRVNETIDQASCSQAAIVTGIMIDKARLLSDQSTANLSLSSYLGVCNDVPISDSY